MTEGHPLDGIESQVTAWRAAYASIKKWKFRANRARLRITETLDAAGATVGTLGGVPVVRLEPSTRERLDVERLRAERPDIYAEYATVSARPRLWNLDPAATSTRDTAP